MSGAAAAVLSGRRTPPPGEDANVSGLHAIQHLIEQPSSQARAQVLDAQNQEAMQRASLQDEEDKTADTEPRLWVNEVLEHIGSARQQEKKASPGANTSPSNRNQDILDSPTFRDSFQDQTFQRIKTIGTVPSVDSLPGEPVIEADVMSVNAAQKMVEDHQRDSLGKLEDSSADSPDTSPDERRRVSTSIDIKAMAAARIARIWLNKKYNKYVDRDIFADRLDLEDKLGRGCLKITINVVMFVLIITCLGLGIPSSEKLATQNLLKRALNIDSFLEVQTIDGLRDFLPELSSNIKVFSASSVTVDGTEVLSERSEFTDPVTIIEFAPAISQPSWTLSAWVERISGSDGSGNVDYLSILRQPMSTNRSLSCWGWFHPHTLRYGAHDFFQFEEVSTQLEEIVSVPHSGEDLTSLSMETLTLSNGYATFYRNGVKVATVKLPRLMTDCINPEPVELGQADLALASVKFYSRALSENEVEEMYRGGQPLFELASGSGALTVGPKEALNAVDSGMAMRQEELLQLGVKLEKQGIALTETLDDKEERDVVSTILGEPLQADDPLRDADDPTFPADPSPTAILPDGNRSSAKLTETEYQAWTAGGQRTEGHMTARWETDESLGGRAYWSVFEHPIYVAGGAALPGTLPHFDRGVDGMSISYWFKPTKWFRAYGPHVRLLHGPETGWASCTADGESEDTADFTMQLDLDWVLLQLRVGSSCVRDWRFLTYFDKENGRIKETYLLSAFAQEVSPVTWRHIMFQYGGAQGNVRFFLDGRLVFDTLEVPPSESAGYHKDLDRPLRTVSEIFSNMTVVPHSKSEGSDWDHIPGKMAQFRVLPWVLTPAEVLTLHEEARWPDGARVKQCINPVEDDNYYDTTQVDARRQSCEWYYRMQLKYPYICRLAWLKTMCPVVCSGQRLCHDGRLDVAFNEAAKPKKYWLFDRIVYLKPKQQGRTVLCRSRDLDVAKVLETCEAVAREEAKGESSTLTDEEDTILWRYRQWLTTLFDEIERFDVTNCTQLQAALAEERPCTFDTSWLPEFAADFNKTKTWSLTFWLRPKGGSLGMPTNFWFAAKFFASLQPPTMLNHWTEGSPDLEPWMDAETLYKKTDGSVSRKRAAIWPTTSVDYVNQWTMYHFQFQEVDASTSRLCGSINALPMDCTTFDGGMLIDPAKLIEAVEFTTELLVSPIEVSAAWFSRADIQLRFYRKVAGMGRVLGPMQSTFDAETSTGPSEPEGLSSFDQRAALLAPPLMFQTRAKQKTCDRKVTSTFLEGQVELKRAALCQGGQNCEFVTTDSIATCFDRSQDEDQPYWGNDARKRGYSEFLYVSDSPNIVRPDSSGAKTVVQTREFVNGLTMTASVLAVFHSPVTGLTTAVELSADVASPEVKTRAEFMHLGFVDSNKFVELVASYACLGVFIIALMVNGFFMLRRYRRFRSLHENNTYKTEIAESTGDIVQGVVILAFCSFSLYRALASESNIEDIVGDIRKVSWIDRDVAFTQTVDQFFEAVDRFRFQLQFETAINTAAVIILFFLLFQIFAGTSMHPHTGVLAGTVWTTFMDLHHFFLLFMLINCLFAFAATWVFGSHREEFQDLRATLNTQFTLLLDPNLPDKYEEDPLLVAYVVSCTVVIFFFMLNFLLAIVVDGYMKVREQIENNLAESEFLTDLTFTIYAKAKGMIHNWPKKKDLAIKLRAMRVKRICATHLRSQGLDIKGVVSMFNHYAQYSALQCAPPEWKGMFYNYDRADHLSVQSFQRMMTSVEHLRSGMEAIQERLGMERLPSPKHHIPKSTKKKRTNDAQNGSRAKSGMDRTGSESEYSRRVSTSNHGNLNHGRRNSQLDPGFPSDLGSLLNGRQDSFAGTSSGGRR